jgi:hypothetical protein
MGIQTLPSSWVGGEGVEVRGNMVLKKKRKKEEKQEEVAEARRIKENNDKLT